MLLWWEKNEAEFLKRRLHSLEKCISTSTKELNIAFFLIHFPRLLKSIDFRRNISSPLLPLTILAALTLSDAGVWRRNLFEVQKMGSQPQNSPRLRCYNTKITQELCATCGHTLLQCKLQILSFFIKNIFFYE